jgi:TonB family protein
MPRSIASCLLVAGLLAAAPAFAAAPGSDAAAPDKLRPQFIALRVSVDAAGKVQAAQPLDPQALPGLNRAAEEVARKLTFSPARKNGVAVPSETSLSLTLALEPRGDGQFGLQLKRAQNGPTLLAVGKTEPPKYQQGKQNGALVIVGVALKADGTPDMATLAKERMELRVPSAFAEARYLDTATKALRGSRFQLDKVDGVAIPAHISVPFRFGGGPAKPKPGEGESRRGHQAPVDMDLPSMNAVSTVAGIELARIDYTAPAAPAAPAAAEAKR